MEPLRYKPYAYWTLDGSTPFSDHSGYNRAAVLTGTELHGIALVPHAQYSQVLGTNTITFASNVYKAGRESDPFTILATITPVHKGTDGPQQILSSSTTAFDLITISGTIVSFSTKYSASGEAKCSYDIQFLRKIDVAGVHTKNKNMLFINGVLVAEVGITADQVKDTYINSGSYLYSGQSINPAVQGFMINGVALYNNALQPSELGRIWNYNNRRAPGDIAKSFGGESILISNAVRPPFLEVTYTENADWRRGQLKNCSVKDGQLLADKFNGVTVKGTWLNSIDLYRGSDPVALNSVNLMWTGANVTVEASVDTLTWMTVQRGSNVSVIPPGFDPTNKALYIKVTFNEDNTEGYIDNLRVAGYLVGAVTPPNGRTITWTNPACCFPERPALELRDDWGVALVGGRVTVGADTSGNVYDARTVEMWLKKDSATTPTFSFSPTTTYVNGATGNTAATVGRGEWALYHFVLPSTVSTFYIEGTATVGKIAIYNTALTSTQCSDIYNNHKGIASGGIIDGGSITLTTSTEVVIYSHDWEIVAA